MDLIDKANQHAEQMLAAALSKHTGKSRYQGMSLAECADCGEAIPPRRQAALPGVKYCVACQALRERRGR